MGRAIRTSVTKYIKMKIFFKHFLILIIILAGIINNSFSQDVTYTGKILDQYDDTLTEVRISVNNGPQLISGNSYLFTSTGQSGDSVEFSKTGFKSKKIAVKEIKDQPVILKKDFSWKDLVNPQFYIVWGGLWLFLFIVFAETGLFAGFFLPGDSLLFVAGIYCNELIRKGIGFDTGSDFISLLLLSILVIIAGVLGNSVGYWFGRKSGPALFNRKDTFLFKKKYLYNAKEFYDNNGASAIVIARFLPIIRTFAPIIAGIVSMDKKKFSLYNIIGCVAWATTMLFAGHYLYRLFLEKMNFDLKKHLEIIVIGIVLVTTLPVIYKLFFGKKKTGDVI